jgi:hypothetical protein
MPVKLFLNKTYKRDRVGKRFSDIFPIKNILKKGDVLSPMLLNFFRICRYEGLGKPGGLQTKWYTSAFGLC